MRPNLRVFFFILVDRLKCSRSLEKDNHCLLTLYHTQDVAGMQNTAFASEESFGQEAQLPLRNRAMYFVVTFYRRNDLQLCLITPEAYVR